MHTPQSCKPPGWEANTAAITRLVIPKVAAVATVGIRTLLTVFTSLQIGWRGAHDAVVLEGNSRACHLGFFLKL